MSPSLNGFDKPLGRATTDRMIKPLVLVRFHWGRRPVSVVKAQKETCLLPELSVLPPRSEAGYVNDIFG